MPGCWLKSDHDRFSAERDKPKRKLFAGRSRELAEPDPVVAEFA
jgi:hypothetical protein